MRGMIAVEEKRLTASDVISIFKVRIVVFLVLTALAGYALTAKSVDYTSLVWLLATTFVSCAAASALNNIYDVDIDGIMSRTKSRATVRGAISRGNLAVISLALLGLSLAASYIFNGLTACLMLFMGAVFYVPIYTIWLKRRHWISVDVGGLAGSFVLLAGSAAGGSINEASILFAFIMFIWTPFHFWALTIAICDDYKSAGIPMMPCVKGVRTTGKVIGEKGILLVITTLVSLVVLNGWYVYWALAIFGCSLVIRSSMQILKSQTVETALKTHRMAMAYMGLLLIGLFVNFAVRL